MKYTNLENSPELVEKTYKLIEKSFEYTDDNSFLIDFYPLMKKENHKHCHIYIEGDEVVAHIGVLTREFLLDSNTFNFSMYGGIAVHESFRGKGIFKSLFKEIEEQYSKSFLHILWSEKVKLYEKYSFYPCIDLFEFKKESSQQKNKLISTKLNELNAQELNALKKIYLESDELRPNRSEKHWEELKKITSADLFLIKESNIIKNYFFCNKGQDLTNIIHEYGKIDNEYLKLFRNYGSIWCSENFNNNGTNLYAALCKIGDRENFKNFIKKYLDIDTKRFTPSTVDFEFDSENYSFSHQELLQGFFGPGRFEELSSPRLFISGLDSI